MRYPCLVPERRRRWYIVSSFIFLSTEFRKEADLKVIIERLLDGRMLVVQKPKGITLEMIIQTVPNKVETHLYHHMTDIQKKGR